MVHNNALSNVDLQRGEAKVESWDCTIPSKANTLIPNCGSGESTPSGCLP